MPNYHRSEKVEQVPAGSALQDGINILGQGCPPQRGLDGQVGPPGCLPYSPLLQEIPKVSMDSTCNHTSLATAPKAFTILTRPVVACLRQQGIRLVQYLDDTLLVTEFPEALKA